MINNLTKIILPLAIAAILTGCNNNHSNDHTEVVSTNYESRIKRHSITNANLNPDGAPVRPGYFSNSKIIKFYDSEAD